MLANLIPQASLQVRPMEYEWFAKDNIDYVVKPVPKWSERLGAYTRNHNVIQFWTGKKMS